MTVVVVERNLGGWGVVELDCVELGELGGIVGLEAGLECRRFCFLT